jgi:hypothetical protein
MTRIVYGTPQMGLGAAGGLPMGGQIAKAGGSGTEGALKKAGKDAADTYCGPVAAGCRAVTDAVAKEIGGRVGGGLKSTFDWMGIRTEPDAEQQCINAGGDPANYCACLYGGWTMEMIQSVLGPSANMGEGGKYTPEYHNLLCDAVRQKRAFIDTPEFRFRNGQMPGFETHFDVAYKSQDWSYEGTMGSLTTGAPPEWNFGIAVRVLESVASAASRFEVQKSGVAPVAWTAAKSTVALAPITLLADRKQSAAQTAAAEQLRWIYFGSAVALAAAGFATWYYWPQPKRRGA